MPPIEDTVLLERGLGRKQLSLAEQLMGGLCERPMDGQRMPEQEISVVAAVSTVYELVYEASDHLDS